MLAAPIPADEEGRIAALRALEILDTPPEERFDRITRIARALFDTPIALVSLVDADRQWFKSHQGLKVRETPRHVSFCGHAIHGSDVFVVADTGSDPRFFDNPLVTGSPSIRFYAGAPLTVGGDYRVGTLCIIDDRPRSLDEGSLRLLRDLADMVERELRHQQVDDAARILRDHEARLRAVMNAMEDMVLLVDASGRLIYANPAAARCFEPGAATLAVTSVDGLIAPGERERFRRMMSRCIEGSGSSFETLAWRNDATFPVNASLQPLNAQGAMQLLCVLRDLGERYRLERIKSDFVTSVSHELRTPLTSIHGALGLITGGAAGAISEKGMELARVAHRNSARLVRLVNDILDVEKIESGRFTMNLAEHDLYALLCQVLEANSEFARQNGVTVDLAGVPGCRARVDPGRFVQVVTNLLSNAIKHSPPSGPVTVTLQRDAAVCRVLVEDRGPGVPEEFRDQLFERFARADAGDGRMTQGTGLGLSLARAIVERLGGDIGYRPRERGGACFHVDLPAV